MVKKVNVTTSKPIYNVLKTPIIGTIFNIRLSTNQIYTCLAGGARVEEILNNGSKITLGIINYNKDNNPVEDDSDIKAKEEAAKKAEAERVAAEAAAKEAEEKAKREEEERLKKEAELKAKEEAAKKAEAERVAAEAAAKEAEEKAKEETKPEDAANTNVNSEHEDKENKEDVNPNHKNSNKRK